MSKRSGTRQWHREHVRDPYVKQAVKAGYRSRAVFKLQEMDRRDHLLRPGMLVIDLGAAPGSWSQYASGRVGPSGRVIALDRLEMDAMPGVEVIKGDFSEMAVLEQLMDSLDGGKADLVISDMAPNISGIASVDQPRSMALVELALDCAQRVLTPGGSFVAKVFQGEGSQEFVQSLRSNFSRVVIRKPGASKPRSSEVYVLASGYGV